MNKILIKILVLLHFTLGVAYNISAQQVAVNYEILVQKLTSKNNHFEKQGRYDSIEATSLQIIQYAKNLNDKSYESSAYDKLAESSFKNGRLTEAQTYNKKLMGIAIAIKDTNRLINGKNREGLFYLEKGKTKEAENEFTEALNLCKNHAAKTAEINSNLGTLYLSVGDKEKAIQYFFKALELYEKNNDLKGIGETNSNISSLYYLMGKIDDAIAFQIKSINVRERADDKNGLAITNSNLGQLYILKTDYEQAFKYIKQAITYAERLNNPKLMASAYSGMSAYYSRTKNFPEALVWQSKAIKFFEEIDDKTMLSRLYVSAGNLSNVNKDSLKAFNYYIKALNLSLNLGNKENIANANEKLSAFFSGHMDFEKAYTYYKNYILYRDSIIAKSNLGKIEEIKTKYETEKKDAEIFRLNTLQNLKELQLEKQHAIINGNLLLAKKKEIEIEVLSKESKILTQNAELQHLQIMQQDEKLEKQKLIVKNNEQQLLLSESDKVNKGKQIATQKKLRNVLIGGIILMSLLMFSYFNRYQLKKKLEQQKALLSIRNTISKDLHDEIGSTLTSISILSKVSEMAMEKQPLQAKEMIHQIALQSKTIQQNMSDIVWSIRPENESIENLATRIREYAAQTLEPLQIDFSLNVDETLIAQKMSMIFRKELLLICKEAINNIAKHSGATIASLSIVKDKKQIALHIMDNGKWKGGSTGTGTKSMQERANSIGGSLTFSITEGGTEVVAYLPIP